MDVKNIQKGPDFYIFWHYATYRTLQKKSKKVREFFPHAGPVEENT